MLDFLRPSLFSTPVPLLGTDPIPRILGWRRGPIFGTSHEAVSTNQISDRLLRRFLTKTTQNNRAGHRRARILRCESLEGRRLLAAEGSLFSFNEAFDASGIAGDVRATIHWGDGTSSAASSVSPPETAGDLSIRFDYSLDTGGFFSGAGQPRRELLEIAATSIVSRFGDQLDAIAPGGIKQWQPSVFHPSIGAANQSSGDLTPLAENMPVAENEIIIYPGARDLPGSHRGVGGPASYTFPASQFSCQTQAECDAKLAEIEAFRDSVRGRGQVGALASPQHDVAPHIGSISFDNDTDWYFGIEAGGIQSGEVDFISVAVHEITHVLGFGITRTDVTTSWQRAIAGGVFTGPSTAAVYNGNGSPAVESNHWDVAVEANHPVLMGSDISTGVRQLLSPLDFAAMDDLGWELLDTHATVAAEHRFSDDGTYAVDVVLTGTQGGEVVHRVTETTTTNVSPTLTVVGNQSAIVGQPLDLENIGVITDPGFRNVSADPPTIESFSYTIEWGDGVIDQGSAAIDVHGDASGGLTSASFDGSHTYEQAGIRTVTIRVTDDDGGVSQRTFSVDVISPPSLSLELDRPAISEDDGDNAATLTIRRSGPATGSDQVIQLASDDTLEAVLPATALIPGNATSVSVPVDAVDDNLLDGESTVALSASADGLLADHIDLIVRDAEFLTATFSAGELRENESSPVNLLLRRSNSDTADPLVIDVSGGDRTQIDLPLTITIPANRQEVEIPLDVIDDLLAERTMSLEYQFSAAGYSDARAEIELLDDEPPLFQNPTSRFDVNNDGQTSASDALRVINQLHVRGDATGLDPQSEQPDGVYLDVNGDYELSAIDALLAINELARLSAGGSSDGEAVGHSNVAPPNRLTDDENDETMWWLIEVGVSG